SQIAPILFLIVIQTLALSGQESKLTAKVELSQNFSNWKDHYHVLDPVEGWVLKDFLVSTFTFSISSGIKISSRWEAGIGIGIDYNDKQVFTSIPFSIYLNHKFLNSDSGFYYTELRGAYGPGFLQGENTPEYHQSLDMSFLGLDIGKYFSLKNSDGLSIALSYRLQ